MESKENFIDDAKLVVLKGTHQREEVKQFLDLASRTPGLAFHSGQCQLNPRDVLHPLLFDESHVLAYVVLADGNLAGYMAMVFRDLPESRREEDRKEVLEEDKVLEIQQLGASDHKRKLSKRVGAQLFLECLTAYPDSIIQLLPVNAALTRYYNSVCPSSPYSIGVLGQFMIYGPEHLIRRHRFHLFTHLGSMQALVVHLLGTSSRKVSNVAEIKALVENKLSSVPTMDSCVVRQLRNFLNNVMEWTHFDDRVFSFDDYNLILSGQHLPLP